MNKEQGANTIFGSEDSANKKSQSIGITTSNNSKFNAFESMEKFKNKSQFKKSRRGRNSSEDSITDKNEDLELSPLKKSNLLDNSLEREGD